MTLADITLPVTYEWGVAHALIFGVALAQRLAEVQAETPTQHWAVPTALSDGRFALCGDLLSEVGPGGLYAPGFSRLDAGRFDEIEVIAWADAVALMPADDPEPVT